MPPALTDACTQELKDQIDGLELAFPRADTGLEQDEEWVVVQDEGQWRKVRLHDYDELFGIPGLYERWIYDILDCQSPQQVRSLLLPSLEQAGVAAESLSVLDLGAGNGYVAGVLSEVGVEKFVGVDINPNAAVAAERDRPGLYSDFVIDDLTDLSAENAAVLDQHDFNCLTCVAALGFGDIPLEVFVEAFNRIDDGGWVAFTINSNFLEEDTDESGFSKLIREMIEKQTLELASQKTFEHRKSSDGHAVMYDAIIGRKRSDWS